VLRGEYEEERVHGQESFDSHDWGHNEIQESFLVPSLRTYDGQNVLEVVDGRRWIIRLLEKGILLISNQMLYSKNI